MNKQTRSIPYRIYYLVYGCLILTGILLAGCAPVSGVNENLSLSPGLAPIRAIPWNGGSGQGNQFIAASAFGSILFSQQGFTMALPASREGHLDLAAGEQIPLRLLKVVYQDTRSNLEPEGLDLQPGVVNRYIGADPRAWEAGLPMFGKVHYQDLYPGIDLVYSGVEEHNAGILQLKGTFFVAPGADPARIKWGYSGASAVVLGENGNLELEIFEDGVEDRTQFVTEFAPVAWQMDGNDQITIPVQYKLDSEGTVGFDLGPYDPDRPLIIDPVIEYSTFFGGSGFDEGIDVAVDGSRSPVIVGTTLSVDFPSELPLQEELIGNRNIFLTKFSRDGLSVDFTTVIGGTGDDFGQSLAIDAAGDIYVAGYTVSTDFPATALSGIPEGDSGENGFLVKFSLSGGTIRYSALIGGSDVDRIHALDVDSGGNTYLAGFTSSSDFPLKDPIQPSYGGGETDAFAVKLSAVGNDFLYSSYLGGLGNEEAHGIAVDRKGGIYLTGFTDSVNFPVIAPLQEEMGGQQDTFLTKIDEDFEAYAYSTYLGIGIGSVGNEVVVDREGHAYIVGNMERTEPEDRGGSDAYVLKLGVNGDTLDINVLLGGKGDDEGYDLGLDEDQNVYVVGYTESAEVETTNLFQTNYGGEGDAFLAQLDPLGNLVTFNFIGGSDFDVAHGIAVFGSGDAVVSGVSFSDNFPTVNSIQRTNQGEGDVFVLKIGEVEFVPTPAPTNTPEPTPLPPTPTPTPTVFEAIVVSNTFLYVIFGLIGLVLLLLIFEIIRNARRKR